MESSTADQVRWVSISDFQSLKSVQLDLGQLTVITGPSNSGKSAFGRALRAVFRNKVSVASGLRTGAKTFGIGAYLSHQEVEFTRGKSISTYILDGQQYDNAGITVPDDVVEHFGMPLVLGTDLNLTTQFDPPYLLTATGSEAARALGELTNANLLAEAAREAVKRKQEAEREVRVLYTRKESLELCLEAYQDLPERLVAVKAMQLSLEQLRADVGERDELAALVKSWQESQMVLDQARQPKDWTDVAKDLDTAASAVAVSNQLREVVTQTRQVQAAVRQAGQQVAEWAVRRADLQQSLTDALVSAGVCPVCDSVIQR